MPRNTLLTKACWILHVPDNGTTTKDTKVVLKPGNASGLLGWSCFQAYVLSSLKVYASISCFFTMQARRWEGSKRIPWRNRGSQAYMKMLTSVSVHSISSNADIPAGLPALCHPSMSATLPIRWRLLRTVLTTLFVSVLPLTAWKIDGVASLENGTGPTLVKPVKILGIQLYAMHLQRRKGQVPYTC